MIKYDLNYIDPFALDTNIIPSIVPNSITSTLNHDFCRFRIKYSTYIGTLVPNIPVVNSPPMDAQ